MVVGGVVVGGVVVGGIVVGGVVIVVVVVGVVGVVGVSVVLGAGVVIFCLVKQVFWQPSKQQRPKGSWASLVGQSTSLVPGDQQIGFLPATAQTS